MPRTLAEWLTALAWAMLLAGLASCTRRVDTAASTHAEVARQVDATADVVTETRTEQAPGRVTTTIDEYSPAPTPTGRADRTGEGRAPEQPMKTAARQLIRRTVRVEERGAVVRETAQEARRATETHGAAKVDAATEGHTSTRAGPSPALWLGIGAGLVALLAAAWRFRRLLGVPS